MLELSKLQPTLRSAHQVPNILPRVKMVVRKAAGTLTKQEKSIVKTLLQKGWRNQDIQALLNIHRKTGANGYGVLHLSPRLQ